MIVPDSAPSSRPVRLERPERPERVSPNVTSWGYHPPGAGGSSVPSWLWAAVGLAALVAVLVSAIQIARAPKPLAVPGASKPQLASAESLAVLLRADSTQAGPNIALGNLYYDTGNFAEAVPYYKRALRKDPDLTDVRVDLGVSYHNMQDLANARAELEEAVRRQPDHPVAQFDLAVVYQTMGMKDEARAHYLKARSLDAPPEMIGVIDQLLARLDEKQPEVLPPGHPAVP
jgi:tetratricopeptide (TPR) repeat protein